jgi:parallel beta-helix repeat protein
VSGGRILAVKRFGAATRLVPVIVAGMLTISYLAGLMPIQRWAEVPSLPPEKGKALQTDLDRILGNAVNYLCVNFNSSLGLICNSPDDPDPQLRNTYYLYSDNYIANLVLKNHEPYNDTLTAKADDIMDTIREYLAIAEVADPTFANHANQYMALNERVFAFNDHRNYELTQLLNQSEVCGARILTTINNLPDYLCPKEYSDISFLQAIYFHETGELDKSKAAYDCWANRYDGKGFPDQAFLVEGNYTTYKLALYIYASKLLGRSYNQTAYDTLLSMQQDNGGFATFYDSSLQAISSTNTETTSLAALCLDPPGSDALIPHQPIYIRSNLEFTTTNGVVLGNGTTNNPYVIAGWDIDSLASDYGIRIENADAYFVVRNCSVRNGSSFYGIYLDHCVNGIVKHNTLRDDYSGIALSSSTGIIVTHNTCESNFDDITLISSNNNIVSDNLCRATEQTSILLDFSSRNILTDNVCDNGFDGIYLYNSDNNTLIGNTCDMNSWGGIDFRSASNNTLVNNICSNGWSDGIYIEYSSDDNTIHANFIYGYSEYGIEIVSGSCNKIWNNTFQCNITYDPSHPEAYDDGTGNSWNSTSGRGNYWSDWLSPDLDVNGIVDDPYLLGGSAGARDFFPLTSPVDFENPVTEVVIAGAHRGEWYVGLNSLHLFASDLISGVNCTRYRVNGGPWQLWNPYGSVVDMTEEGIYTVLYYSQDNSGSSETVRNATFKVDTTGPLTQYSLSGTQGANHWYVTPVNLTFSSTDNLSGVNCTRWSSNQQTTWNVYMCPIEITADGMTVIDYCSQDRAWNRESARALNIYVDMSFPSLSIGIGNDTKFTSSSVYVDWTAWDSGSGVNMTEWRLDGGAWLLSTGSPMTLTGLKDGSHSLTIRVTDGAGHNTTRTVSFRINTNMFSFSGPVGPWLDIGLILLAIAVAVLAVVLYRRRKQSIA